MQKHWNKVTFFNHYGNGDLFNSREFVKYLMRSLHANLFSYAHAKSPRMFEDIPNLHHEEIQGVSDRIPFKVEGDDLYINTWIGRDSKYVLPNISCTLEKNVEMYNDILSAMGEDVRVIGTPADFIPRINYRGLRREYLNNIDSFMDKVSYRPRVLISNGDVQSNQAFNFDFTPIIMRLSQSFPKLNFFITTDISQKADNIFFTGDIIKTEDNFNLNEHAWLARYMDIIIGRSSGPYTFTQTLDNIDDPVKTYLAFSYGAMNIRFSYTYLPKAKYYWSYHKGAEEVYTEIARLLK